MSLFNLHSIHSWFSLTLQRPRTSRWEVVFVSELFVLLLERLKESFIEKSGKAKFSASAKRKEIIVKIAARQVLTELGEVEDEGKTRWYATLEKLTQEPWPL
uniref:Uncharacterized protein n=1 Tax=Acrobeloides nanus TaxID=290746 RepID=A0A914CLN9_9BILA